MNNKATQTNETTFAVHVRPETFSKSPVDTITGVLYVTVGDDFAFPDENWDDIVVEVISWWMRCLSEMLEEGEHQTVCNFMDGKFQFVIDVRHEDAWLVRCVKGDINFDEEGEYEVLREAVWEPHTIVDALLAAADIAAEACRVRGWSTKKINRLAEDRARLVQLRELLSPVAV